MKERILIAGAGNLGVYLSHIAETVLGHHVLGYLDNFKISEADREVVGKIDDAVDTARKLKATGVVFAVGYHNMAARKQIYLNLHRTGLRLISLIHPNAVVDASCHIGMGSHILAGCILDRNVVVDENVLLNIGSVVAHDSVIRSHTFVSPRVAVAGFCEIGELNVLGINSTIIDNIVVAPGNIIGAGSVVADSISESGGIYVGIPSRRINVTAPEDRGLYRGKVAPY